MQIFISTIYNKNGFGLPATNLSRLGSQWNILYNLQHNSVLLQTIDAETLIYFIVYISST